MARTLKEADPDVTTLDEPRDEPATAPAPSRPKVINLGGRGKNGKTTAARWLIGRTHEQGRSVIVGDADRTNQTLAAFFPEVSSPASPELGDMTEWTNANLDAVAEYRTSLLLDFGGGDTFWRQYARELGIVRFCVDEGVDLVTFVFLSDDIDDLSYLQVAEDSGIFDPHHTLLVLNAGARGSDVTDRALKTVREHSIFRNAIDRGAEAVVMPRLGCMSRINEERLLFSEAASGKAGGGKRALGATGRAMTRTWLSAMEEAFSPVADWLP